MTAAARTVDASPRPVMLVLDIDGVILPMSKTPTRPAPVVWHRYPAGEMFAHTDVIDAIRTLTSGNPWHGPVAQTGVANGPAVACETSWLTSWQEDAAEHLAPTLDLPALHTWCRRDAARDKYLITTWWKARIVCGLLDQGRVVAWADDEHETRYDYSWMQSRWPGQLHLVPCASHLGVDPVDLHRVLLEAGAGQP